MFSQVLVILLLVLKLVENLFDIVLRVLIGKYRILVLLFRHLVDAGEDALVCSWLLLFVKISLLRLWSLGVWNQFTFGGLIFLDLDVLKLTIVFFLLVLDQKIVIFLFVKVTSTGLVLSDISLFDFFNNGSIFCAIQVLFLLYYCIVQLL